MERNQQSEGGGYAWNKGNKTYASGGKGGGGNKKSVDAATALGLGVPPQNTMLSGMAGLGMMQQNPLDSLFGAMGTNAITGLGGLNDASLQSTNSASSNSRPYSGAHSSRMLLFNLLRFLQVRQALAQQHATQVAAHQSGIQKEVEAEATARAAELVKIEHEKQKQKKKTGRERDETR